MIEIKKKKLADNITFGCRPKRSLGSAYDINLEDNYLIPFEKKLKELPHKILGSLGDDTLKTKINTEATGRKINISDKIKNATISDLLPLELNKNNVNIESFNNPKVATDTINLSSWETGHLIPSKNYTLNHIKKAYSFNKNLDPPFNSNAVYNLTYKSPNSKTTAQQKAFSDMWTPTSQTQLMFEDFKLNLKTQTLIDDSVKTFLEVWLESLSNSTYNNQKLLNYLLYMTERLILMKGVLKETGSIYLHCDPTASHYLKVIMDGIFSSENFRNEIVWCYDTAGRSKKYFAKKHGTKNSKGEAKYYKYYLDESKIPNDYWVDIPALQSKDTERLGYPTQKPRALL